MSHFEVLGIYLLVFQNLLAAFHVRFVDYLKLICRYFCRLKKYNLVFLGNTYLYRSFLV